MDDHFGLLTDTDYTGDVTGANWNRVTKTIRRVVGEMVQKIIYAGCLTTSDWRIATGKTIGAGEGIVDDTYCETTTTTDISALLVDGATNYVYLLDNSDSPTDGDIVAAASILASAPDYACRLGSITLNALGAVTAVDNDDEDFMRDYALPLRWRRYQFDSTVTVPYGTYADIEIDHSADVTFVHAFAPKLSSITENTRATLAMHGTTNGKFTMRIYNDGLWGYGYGAGGYGYGYGYTPLLTSVRVIGERWGI